MYIWKDRYDFSIKKMGKKKKLFFVISMSWLEAIEAIVRCPPSNSWETWHYPQSVIISPCDSLTPCGVHAQNNLEALKAKVMSKKVIKAAVFQSRGKDFTAHVHFIVYFSIYSKNLQSLHLEQVFFFLGVCVLFLIFLVGAEGLPLD